MKFHLGWKLRSIFYRLDKSQTYIEPSVDVWSRAKKKWNMFLTDPKGELLAKFYYPLTVRGFDIVQFNLMHPNLTNVYNPLANAVQAFRQNNPVKGTSLIDSIVDTLFPDNGEIWNPAAGNMFRRAVYLLFDYFIEQEKYIRYLGHKNNTPQEVIDQEIDKNYSKVTLFNVYSMIGELAAKVSKDVKFINVDPSAPPVNEKDLLTLVFDAMAMLPTNDLRSKAITANNAIKQIAGAQQTISGIYATLLTGLSVYADDTAIALMSGSLSESFDVAGLGFPRRVGIQLDASYVKKFRLTEEPFKWTIYRDPQFTDKYEGKDYEHIGKIPTSNWIWGYFAGIIKDEVAYLKLDIQAGGTIAKTFYFKFIKGYRKYDGITYVINKITHKKMISGGTLIELDPKTKQPCSGEFRIKQLDIMSNAYHDVDKPIIVSNQVFYSENPKAIFAITPPHLQVYQKHILVIIKQILDEQYSNSYVVKQSRKPIVGLQMMLDEFGNIRSGKNGIPNIDTATSIALGQDVQITFVLQSFQQLRAIYGDDVEKILRANSSNTIFLKSNDKELIDELVRLSGNRHKQQMKSKSVSRKQGDIITVSEPVINYSAEDTETTTLTANDLLFLAGPSPGNSITFSSGEMPIVNKLANITPMAAGLHQHLPQPKDGQYSDSTMPTTATSDGINYLDNMIDGEALTRARVAQAKIWNEQLKPKVEKLAKREGIKINERDGSLADLVMNTVYEIYDKNAGQSRENLSDPEPYWKKAQKLRNDILLISNNKESQANRLAAVDRVREELVRCAMDPELDKLTKIYRDTQATGKVSVGYDQTAVSRFVIAFGREYPPPKDLKLDHKDIFSDAENDPNYHEYQGNQEKDFDVLNPVHTGALEQYLTDVVLDRANKVNGLKIEENEKASGMSVYRASIENSPIWRAEIKDGQVIKSTITQNENVEPIIAKNAQLMSEINNRIDDGDN